MKNPIIDEEQYTNYFTNLIRGKRIPCYNIVNGLFSGDCEIKTLYQGLLQRSLYSVGELWEYNKITVATEHMATLITESLMNQMAAQLPIGEAVNKTVIISSVEDEPHQIGGKMVADIFELHGWNTIYLGANTPVQELISFIREVQPNLVGLSMSVYFHIDTLKRTLQSINDNFKDLPVIIGGQAFKRGGSSIIENFKNTTYLPTLDALEDYIKNFLAAGT
ncbi:MAG: cobalamin-dependent protein [Desulfamplus sp.]|nr:cobalamin-dependent protein [Desulfamplus sp.]